MSTALTTDEKRFALGMIRDHLETGGVIASMTGIGNLTADRAREDGYSVLTVNPRLFFGVEDD